MKNKECYQVYDGYKWIDLKIKYYLCKADEVALSMPVKYIYHIVSDNLIEQYVNKKPGGIQVDFVCNSRDEAKNTALKAGVIEKFWGEV